MSRPTTTLLHRPAQAQRARGKPQARSMLAWMLALLAAGGVLLGSGWTRAGAAELTQAISNDDLDAIRSDAPTISNEFDRPSDAWDSDLQTERYDLSLSNGALRFRVRDENTLVWSLYGAGEPVSFDSFLLEVEAVRIASRSGMGGEGNYGIVFGRSDADNYYLFTVRDDTYSLRRLLAGEWETLIDWTAADAINPERRATNRLGLHVQGAEIALVVNDTIVAQRAVEAPIPGTIGLAAGTFAGGTITIDFERMALWTLDAPADAATEPDDAAEVDPEVDTGAETEPDTGDGASSSGRRVRVPSQDEAAESEDISPDEAVEAEAEAATEEAPSEEEAPTSADGKGASASAAAALAAALDATRADAEDAGEASAAAEGDPETERDATSATESAEEATPDEPEADSVSEVTEEATPEEETAPEESPEDTAPAEETEVAEDATTEDASTEDTTTEDTTAEDAASTEDAAPEEITEEEITEEEIAEEEMTEATTAEEAGAPVSPVEVNLDEWISVEEPAFQLLRPVGWEVAHNEMGRIDLRSPEGMEVAIWPLYLPEPIDDDTAQTLLQAQAAKDRPDAEWSQPVALDGQVYRLRAANDEQISVANLAWMSSPQGTALTYYLISAPTPEYARHAPVFRAILESVQILGADAPAPGAELEFVNWQDPMEDAFSAEVPQSWEVTGGLHRMGAVDTRPWLNLTDPASGAVVIVGDPDIPPFTLPNDTLAWLGIHEGDWSTTSGGVDMLVSRYLPGATFAETYISEYLAAGACTVLETGNLPELEEITRAATGTPDYLQMAGLSIDIGHIRFRCGEGDAAQQGWILAGTNLLSQFGVGVWNVSLLLGYLAPENDAATAEAVLAHVVRTWQVDPQWHAAQLETTRVVSGITTQTGQEINAIINSAFENAQATQAATAQDFSDTLLEVERVEDARTGEVYELKSGSNYYWIDAQGNILGTDVHANPDGLRFEEMIDAP